MQFDKATNDVLVWTKQDGLPFDDFSSYVHYQTPDGRLFMGGGDGRIISFYPKEIIRQERKLALSQYLEFDNENTVFVDQTEKVDAAPSINIEPSVTSVMLKMALFDYTTPKNTVYAHKIDSKSERAPKHWNFQKDNIIRLNNLPYGQHEIQIRAVGTDNSRAQGELTVPVFVEKPFYLKAWFLFLTGIGIVGLITGFFRWRTWQLRRDKKRLETEVANRTATIEQQKAELEASNATKDKLMAIIGHDLRGPLFHLQGLEEQINYLLETGQMERLKELGAAMEKSTRYLTDTLNNLLNWSMHQMGRFPYQPENVSLTETTEKVFALFENNAKAKGIDLESRIPNGTTAFVDKNALATILRNLVNNAIKFSEQGGEVKVSASRQNGEVYLSVEDSGVGMSKELIRQIMSGQEPSRKRGTSGEKSTGLGLILCKDLIEQNKGALQIRSDQQEGSTFLLTFPTEDL